uniref:Uncharacterized protein n=1 Tax=Parascaris equorum TaxID=6256 RepID=A0A914RZ60_PAREQ
LNQESKPGILTNAGVPSLPLDSLFKRDLCLPCVILQKWASSSLLSRTMVSPLLTMQRDMLLSNLCEGYTSITLHLLPNSDSSGDENN